MNERDLSEKLEDIANRLEETNEWPIIKEIIAEIRKLSNETYAPGNSLSWGAVAPKPTKKAFTQKGKRTPF